MRRRMRLDLPAPDEPTRKTKSPESMSRSTSRSASVPFGYRLLTSSSVISSLPLPRSATIPGRALGTTSIWSKEVLLVPLCYAPTTSMRRDCNLLVAACAVAGGSAGQIELRLRRPGRGERRDRRDLRVADRHDLHVHRGAAERTHLLERSKDHNAVRRDEQDLLSPLIDHLDRRNIARLWRERREDHPLAATALRRELGDGGALSKAVLCHRERLSAGTGNAHADHLVALLQADPRDSLRLPAHGAGVGRLEGDRLALPGGEEDAVLRAAWRDPRELVALPKSDRDKPGAPDVLVFGARRLLDEALARRHHEMLGCGRVPERDERRDALSGLHRLEDVLDRRALRGAAGVG